MITKFCKGVTMIDFSSLLAGLQATNDQAAADVAVKQAVVDNDNAQIATFKAEVLSAQGDIGNDTTIQNMISGFLQDLQPFLPPVVVPVSE